MKNIGSLSKRELILAIVSSIVVLCCFIANYWIFPKWDFYKIMLSRERQAKEELQKAQILLAQKDKILSSLRAFSKEEKFEHKSDEEEIAELLREVEKIARDVGVYLKGIKPMPTEVNEYFKSYVIDLDGETDVKRMVTFVQKIESGNALLRIDQCRITAPVGKNHLKLNMTVSKLVSRGI